MSRIIANESVLVEFPGFESDAECLDIDLKVIIDAEHTISLDFRPRYKSIVEGVLFLIRDVNLLDIICQYTAAMISMRIRGIISCPNLVRNIIIIESII